MSRFVIPYTSFGTISRPALKTWLQYGSTVTPFDFYSIIDSGADNCCFPASFAQHIQLNLTNAPKTSTTGSTGIESAHIAKVVIWVEIDGTRYHFSCDSIFQPSLQVGLLGRNGFFNMFSVVNFNEKNRTVILEH